MSVRTSIALILLFLYATILSFSTTLFFVMALPIIAEIWRNFKYIKPILTNLFFLNIFLFTLAISVWLMGEKHLALLIYVRSNFSIFFALLLFYNKSAFDIALGLQELKFPNKLVSLFFFVAKFIYSLKETLATFKKTLHVRGFSPKTSLFTYKSYANFVGMLFINALQEAKSLQNLMILRGFHGRLYTLQQARSMSKYELILSALTIIALVFQKGVLI